VADKAGLEGSATKDFRILRDVEANFQCSLDGSNWVVCENLEISADQDVYFKNTSSLSEGASGFSKESWSFEDASPGRASGHSPACQFRRAGYKEASLSVTDNNNRKDKVRHILNVVLLLPKWREVRPF
jgi:hypothetical protein